MKSQGMMLTQLANGRVETNSGMSLSQMFFKSHHTSSSLGSERSPCMNHALDHFGQHEARGEFPYYFILLLLLQTIETPFELVEAKQNESFFFFFFFFSHSAACGILVPRPGIEPKPSALEE